jgi:predicted MPP superfamily phosphohydrolase
VRQHDNQADAISESKTNQIGPNAGIQVQLSLFFLGIVVTYASFASSLSAACKVMHDPGDPSTANDGIVTFLQHRLGRLHASQRLGIEADHEAQAFGQGLNFFHVENWYSIHAVIRSALWLAGLYGRGGRNAQDVQVRHNHVRFERLPRAFDGFTILQISDMHADLSEGAMRRVIELLAGMEYDVCVLTGDFRGKTFGPFSRAMDGVERVRVHLHSPVYGVLGNHDTIRMVPGLEAIGIRMLLNECVAIERGNARIHLAGIDDAHFFRADNIEKAGDPIPQGEFAALLSHTPEIYRQAAHAGFDLMLSGHTHGGQICLPGGVPITLDAKLPRRFGAGAWTYHRMAGYTSVGAGSSIVAVRLNCLPEITLHHFHCV